MGIRMTHDGIDGEGEAVDEHQFETVWKPLGWKKEGESGEAALIPPHTNTAETGNKLAKPAARKAGA